MSKRLSVPPELEHLIEKREGDGDRRAPDPAGQSDRRKEDLGPLGAIESTADPLEVPTTDRRTGKQRRAKKDRRKNSRRKDG